MTVRAGGLAPPTASRKRKPEGGLPSGALFREDKAAPTRTALSLDQMTEMRALQALHCVRVPSAADVPDIPRFRIHTGSASTPALRLVDGQWSIRMNLVAPLTRIEWMRLELESAADGSPVPRLVAEATFAAAAFRRLADYESVCGRQRPSAEKLAEFLDDYMENDFCSLDTPEEGSDVAPRKPDGKQPA